MRLDDDVDESFGWRATEWDLQGVPIRVEIGPRDLAERAAVLYRETPATRTGWEWAMSSTKCGG